MTTTASNLTIRSIQFLMADDQWARIKAGLALKQTTIIEATVCGLCLSADVERASVEAVTPPKKSAAQ